MPIRWRRSLTYIGWLGSALVYLAGALVRGVPIDRAVWAGVFVGGPALMVLLIGLAEVGFPAKVIRARTWLLADQGPGFGRDLRNVFDSGLGISRGGSYLRLRALGLGLCVVGAVILMGLAAARFI